MAKKKRQGMADQLRQAIEASGMSYYRVSMETGISQATVGRFMAGTVDLRLSNVEKLAELLGFELKHKG